MSFQPDSSKTGAVISPSDIKPPNQATHASAVNDFATLDANDSVRIGEETISIAVKSKEISQHAIDNHQQIKLVHNRPPCNTARNRMYSSQNSFNTLDFDYYDINDCSMYRNNNSRCDKWKGVVGDDLAVANTESPTRVIVKSSSSSNIAMEVQSLFKPPISSSTLPPQH